ALEQSLMFATANPSIGGFDVRHDPASEAERGPARSPIRVIGVIRDSGFVIWSFPFDRCSRKLSEFVIRHSSFACHAEVPPLRRDEGGSF
ncbi:MAG TPA: hypothetical protein VGM65_10955, partial [Candidatus Udaeobacter sp.]